ncbi:MAG: MFS transporter, partial [Candidatus Marinimicrobia bacterium]|nr:MFS transporter [Candidatus Neomarinimicrobiota bacterium]
MLGSMLFVLTGVGISPAMPGMSDYFNHLPNSEFLVKLTLTMPALVIAVAAPFAGILLDRWGRKPVILFSLILYGFAGSSGFWMETLSGILLGRALLGLATAGLMSGIITLIGDLYEGEQLNRFMGYQSAALGIGGLTFLTLAGVLADIGWRYPFLIHLHAFLVIPGVILAVKEPNIG